MRRENVKDFIRVEHLKYEYDIDPEDEGAGEEKIEALKDVSFSIEEGSFTAILGRNGSGKSTLAKCLNGLFYPTSGTVTVNGWDTRDEAHVWDIRQTCGMVFQNPDNQLVAASVEDDIAFGPENLGVPPDEIKERVEEALRAVGMESYREHAPHYLSGGQKQRIAIAGVLAMRPKCIVFDEPTAMLDPKGRRDILALVEDMHRAGKTVVLITHFMEEAAKADRVIVMDEGRTVIDQTPRELFRDQQKLEVYGLKAPLAVEIAARLRADGIDVPDGIVTDDELVDWICQYK